MSKKVLSIKYRVLSEMQRGQVIIILLLLMLLALSIGLAVTQRSITDVATSTQSEQSSRAFSAAEAGIEKALTGTVTSGASFNLGNDSTATVNTSALLPPAGPIGLNMAVEYPPIGRETTAQFWFTDPALVNPATPYNSNQFNLYFGDVTAGLTDKPAVELSVIILKTDKIPSYYEVRNFYIDSDFIRVGTNRFFKADACGGSQNIATTILGTSRKFYCQYLVTVKDSGSLDCTAANTCQLILARARLLYSIEKHPVALSAPIPNPQNAQFPPQAQIYDATGTSGQSQKQIQAFRIKDVVPPWFDFALFSVNEIRK